MKKKKQTDIPVITVPKANDLFDVIDTDDKGYDFGEPILLQEVRIEFERENDTK